MNDNYLGKTIKELRLEEGISQRELGKRLNVGLASAICVLPFAACNQDGGQGTTVTEDKWKTAFSYFTVEWNEETYYPILSDNPA